ncbi:RNA polymerase factor sigma-54, partial [bacterium]|nr:RNA polymerase factor sigma-54 [bacterium]
IAEYIIGNIDDEGYISISLRELLATTSELLELVNKALDSGEIEPVLDEEAVVLFDVFHENREKIKEKKKGRKKKAPYLDEEVSEESVDISLITNEQCGVLENLVQILQTFDPPGVGTRSLQECLRNQLFIMGMANSLAMRIITENMQYLEQKDLKKIARLQKSDIQEVVKAYQIITELEPKPGRPFGGEVTQFVIPDVYIYKRGKEYVVNMNQDTIPKLRINPYYQNLIQKNKEELLKNKKAGSENVDQDMTYQYIVEKIKAGDWLMKSIEQRQKTIYRVTKSILKFQHEFFEKGIDFLRPLVLKDVAEDIEVHESTVSRITTNKYAYTPQGIFELKYFFTSGIDQGDGDIISSKKIKDYIQKLIETEDKKKPYTDLQIKNELLENAGIRVARRTVAKYREAMNILPSNKRKKLF